MNIIVLAAGTGSRLLPFTKNTPKALVKLGGKPLLAYQMQTFSQLGLSKISVVSGYLTQKFDSFPVRKFVNPNYLCSNMVYSLMQAEDLFKENEDLIISYGDIIYEPEILSNLIAKKGDVVVSADKNWKSLWDLRMEDPIQDAESFIYDSHDNILELGKPLRNESYAQAQYIGLIKISADSLTKVLQAFEALGEEKTKNMYLTDFIQYLIDINMNVTASFHQRGWLEVDTVADLRIYEALLTTEQFKKLGMSSQFFQ